MFSIWHWLIVLAVVLVIFGGKGKISKIMGDFGAGLKLFKDNVADDSQKEEDQSDKKEISGDNKE